MVFANTSPLTCRTVLRKNLTFLFLFSDVSQDKIWISPLIPECMTSEIGQMISLLCSTPDGGSTVYEWSKEEQVLCNKSENGLLNVTISSSDDFELYTCHAISSSGVTTYNVSLCQSAVGIVAAVTGMLWGKTAHSCRNRIQR